MTLKICNFSKKKISKENICGGAFFKKETPAKMYTSGSTPPSHHLPEVHHLDTTLRKYTTF